MTESAIFNDYGVMRPELTSLAGSLDAVETAVREHILNLQAHKASLVDLKAAEMDVICTVTCRFSEEILRTAAIKRQKEREHEAADPSTA